MPLRLDMVGIRGVRERLRRFGDLLDDFGPLWDRYSVIMAEVEAEWFVTKGKGTWPPLAASTLKQKATSAYKSRGLRGPFPLDPLIATGKLFRELTSKQAGGVSQGRSTLGTFTEKTFHWGTDDPVAEYHMDGRLSPNFMPRRPPIEWPPSPATMARFERANDEFLEEVARESGVKEA